PAHPAQQRLPLLVRQAAAMPVGAGVLAPVIEEAGVVVPLLERLDLALDEAIHVGEEGGEVLGDLEVHSPRWPLRGASGQGGGGPAGANGFTAQVVACLDPPATVLRAESSRRSLRLGGLVIAWPSCRPKSRRGPLRDPRGERP